uniref:Secreted protein n=1 Tax=Acrobeloides nanus TaxID=290746 RepID=A0A914DBD6_9BILA
MRLCLVSRASVPFLPSSLLASASSVAGGDAPIVSKTRSTCLGKHSSIKSRVYEMDAATRTDNTCIDSDQ